MMGLLGTLVSKSTGMLSLEEIAVGLARMPRFGGQTIIRWTVAEHLLAGMTWMRARYPGSFGLELAFGLHDAHEALTSDVPTTFKTWGLRRLQRRLDRRLCAALGLDHRWLEHEAVKQLDRDMLLAEASVVAPLRTYNRIVAKCGGREASFSHRAAVGEVLGTVRDAQEAWLTRVVTLLERTRK